MATANSSDVQQMLIRARAALETKILRGAARAAAKVVATEAEERCISEEVRGSIGTSSDSRGDQIIAKVQTKGPGAYIAPWLEYGTDPHFITVKEAARRGMSVGTINRHAREGSLEISGRFVGQSVHHPGARPHPFMRPALDAKEGEAIAAAQSYINSRFTKSGLNSAASEDDEA